MFETSEPLIKIDFEDDNSSTKAAAMPQDEADGAECLDDYEDLTSKRFNMNSGADVSNNSTKT